MVDTKGIHKPNAVAACIRFATHFFVELEGYNDQYIAGGDRIVPALSQFDQDWLNIAHAQSSMAELVSELDPKALFGSGLERVAIELCNAFPDAGAYLISLRLNTLDRIRWLQDGLSSSTRLQRDITTQAHLGNLGLAYSELGDYERAILYYEEARKLATKIGDQRHVGTWAGDLGNVYAALGNHQLAVEYHQQHRQIAEEIGDRRGEANALGNLGVSWSALAQEQLALDCYQQQLAIVQEIGDQRGVCHACLNIGLLHFDERRLGEARSMLESSLQIARQIGDQQIENLALGSLSHLLIELEEYQSALENLVLALQIAIRIGDRQGEVRHMTVHMRLYQKLAQFARAADIGEKALRLAKEINFHPEIAYINWQLGVTYEKLGELQQAMDCFQVVLAYDAPLENPNAEKTIEKIRVLAKILAKPDC